MDVDSAFPNAELKDEIYMHPPPELNLPAGSYLKLNRALYGLKQASKEWNALISAYLIELGFKQCLSDNCMFVKGEGDNKLLVVLYVDDLICAAKSLQGQAWLRKALHARFKMKDDSLSQYLGMSINQLPSGHIALSHNAYIKRVVAKYASLIEHIPYRNIPLNTNRKLSRSQCPQTDAERDQMADFPYRSIIGALMYSSNVLQPDINYAVNLCARYMDNPGLEHQATLLDILAYLRDTPDLSIVYGRQTSPNSRLRPNTLYAYVDADHGNDLDTRRSTSSFIVFMNNGPISWRVKAQDSASGGGTSESEYKAVYLSSTEVVWLRTLLEEIGYPQNQPTITFEDNQSTIDFSNNPVHQSRMKHIDIKYHVVRDWLKARLIYLEKIGTDKNLSDIGTKALPASEFLAKRSGCMLPTTDIAASIHHSSRKRYFSNL